MNHEYSIASSFGQGNIQALATLKEISEISLNPQDELVFTLSGFGETNPFNVLAIASKLREFHNQFPNNKLSLRPKGSPDDYLSHIGFYDLAGVSYGKKMGQARPNENYVPIREIVLEGDFYNVIEKRSCELARILHFDNDLEQFLKYAFIETIRNVYEHSQSNTAYVCAQRWPTMNLVEIAILDNGCGIANALKRRFPNHSDEALVRLSIQPGVSALSNHGYLEKDDTWRNSGYGLYALSQMAIRYNGSFLLCSGENALYLKASGIETYKTSFQGTAISIYLRTDTDNDFSSIRKEVIAEGEREAIRIQGSIAKASKSSGGNYNG